MRHSPPAAAAGRLGSVAANRWLPLLAVAALVTLPLLQAASPNLVANCTSPSPTVVCTDLQDGTFSEVCQSGYENYNTDTRSCSDINECATASSTVDCTNTAGSYTEDCASGYENYDIVARNCSASPPTVCADVSGYTAMADHVAVDVLQRHKYLFGVINICNMLNNCSAFSHINGNYITSATSVTSKAQYGGCFYRKSATVCPALVGFEVTVDAISTGLALGTYPDADSAAMACFANTRCKSITSKDWTIQGSAAATSYAHNVCYYRKNIIIDACATADRSVICINLPNGTFSEVCRSGYTGYDIGTRKCTDINECAAADTSVICINTNGSFIERCKYGYTNYSSVARTCTDINECASTPAASVTCTNLIGTYTERCAPGYVKYNGTTRTCIDLDECAVARPMVTCTNTAGGFSEACKTGFENYDAVNRRCSDINECTSADPSVICTNTFGSFVERCKFGYTSYNNSTRKCVVIPAARRRQLRTA